MAVVCHRDPVCMIFPEYKAGQDFLSVSHHLKVTHAARNFQYTGNDPDASPAH